MAETRFSRFRRIIGVVAVVVGLCPLVAGRTIYVANDGSADHGTIQAAIDAASNGDTVLVAPGTYTGDGNRDIDFGGKAITVRSEAGPRACIIDAQGSTNASHRGFYFHRGEQGDSILDGFTITGGCQPYVGGGGVYCSGSSPTIRNCVIVGNAAGGGGGLTLGDSNAVVSNCIVAGNRTLSLAGNSQVGGGLGHGGDGHVILRNCTIYDNRALYGGGVYAGLGRWGKISLVNCILFGNRAKSMGNQISRVSSGMVVLPISVELRNCLIEDDPNALAGSVNLSHLIDCIRGDPLFANPGRWEHENPMFTTAIGIWTDGDYHLKSQAGRWHPNIGSWIQDDVTSPCIDAGDQNTPVGEEPFPNGGRINMGAYGGTVEASKSPLGLSGKYGGGYGTMGNPYLIFTAEQFGAIGAEPADWDKHFKLMADIDLSGYSGHELHLLGIDDTSPFSGVFDGDGHAIFGLGRNSTQEYTSGALFGCLTGTVKGVGLIDPNVGGRLLYYTGALVGDNHGTVSNCYAHDVNVVGAGWYAGGLVGRNLGTIADCNSTGVVHDRSAGGLVGRNGGTITGCRSAAVVSADTIAGGLVGSNISGTIANSCSTGTVTGDDRTGGLVGNNYEGTITCCYSSAEVVGNDGVGGLVGENWQGLVTNCYSAANVKGDRLTGGLVGDSGGGAITNCYATGPTTGRWPVGGITHWRHDDDVVTGCFWDMETTGCSLSAAGTGKTTAQMQTAAAFLAAGWDFTGETANGAEDVWQIAEGQDYPRLFWETKSK